MAMDRGCERRSRRTLLGATAAVGALALALAGVVPAGAATKTTKKSTTKTTAKTTKRTTATTAAKATGSTAAPTTAAVTATSAPTTTPTTIRSKKIVVYSGRAERLVKPILDRFTFETGIDLEVRYADSSQLAATLLEEGDRTRAAVFFSQDAGALGALSKAGAVAKLPERLLDKVDEKYRAADGTWVGLSGRARVFVYDPRQVPTPPGSIYDLTNEKWKGRIGYAPTNASWHAFVTALRVSAGETAARRWLTEFKANNPRAYASNGAVLQAVNQGQIALGLVNHYYLYERIAIDGAANVVARNSFPDEGDPGALVNVAGVAIMKKSANDAAAVALVEFLLSKDAQTYFAQQTSEYPLINGVGRAAGLPALAAIKGPKVDLSDLDSLDKTLTLLRDVGLL